MATTKSLLQDASIRHSVFVQRFAGSQRKEMLKFLERTRRATVARLTEGDITQFNKRKLTALLTEIDGILGEIYEKMGKKLTKNMTEFAAYEAEFSKRMFDKATEVSFDIPSESLLASAVFGQSIVLSDDKLTIEQSLKQFSKAKRKEIIDTINQGLVQGLTSVEIVGSVNKVTQTVQKRHLASLVRTVSNHVSTKARDAVYQANSDVLKGYRWVSTLDGSTTITCQGLDGKIFEEGKGPKPPQHWGCRSVTVPEIKDKYKIQTKDPAIRPSVGPDGAKQVDSRTTYGTWLKTQPRSFQDDVLGKTKAKLFRDGNLSIESFVDKNYSPLTLKELKRKEPLAFERAGLTNDS